VIFRFSKSPQRFLDSSDLIEQVKQQSFFCHLLGLQIVYFSDGVGIRTHRHTLRIGYLDGGPGVGTRRLEGQKIESRHVCIRICVQSTHAYIYARRRDEFLE